MEHYELVHLSPGLHSLRSVHHGETFHPGIGPLAEANILHVQQQRLVARAQEFGDFVVWDVGFGAAANALAAIQALQCGSARVEIHSFDLTTSAVEFALEHSAELSYLVPYQDLLRTLVREGQVQVRPGLLWKFHLGDFARSMKDPVLPSPHAVLYDPYSPTQNPEMWTLGHFTSLRGVVGDERPCLWTNYTRSTAVRVALLLAGFFVGKGCSLHEKLETTVASNRLELLEAPLDGAWLERVRRSGNAAPLRSGGYSLSPISSDDYELLCSCPQFN